MSKQDKCSATQLDRIVIHRGDTECRIYAEELQKYLDSGWELGISDKHRTALRAKHVGQPAWNKGLTKETNSSVKSTSEKLLGKPGHSAWNKGISKETNRQWAEAIERGKQTKINKFGNAFGNNNMSEEHKQKIGNALRGRTFTWDPEVLKIKLQKEWETKKANHTFNTSNPEEVLFNELSEQLTGKTIIRQYKDERYPFHCDFYVVEDDLFIELNRHWTHGGHPYDPTNQDDIKKVELWKEKAKTSNFYKIALEVWTIRDPQKLTYAKQNNLNYKIIY